MFWLAQVLGIPEPSLNHAAFQIQRNTARQKAFQLQGFLKSCLWTLEYPQPDNDRIFFFLSFSQMTPDNSFQTTVSTTICPFLVMFLFFPLSIFFSTLLICLDSAKWAASDCTISMAFPKIVWLLRKFIEIITTVNSTNCNNMRGKGIWYCKKTHTQSPKSIPTSSIRM